MKKNIELTNTGAFINEKWKVLNQFFDKPKRKEQLFIVTFLVVIYSVNGQKSPYPDSPVIKGISLEATISSLPGLMTTIYMDLGEMAADSLGTTIKPVVFRWDLLG